MPNCTNCPRNCKNNSYCGKDFEKIRVAKVMRHIYEEPIICPKNQGSGAIFFSNCSLKCVFCQNYQLSHFGVGRDISVNELAEIFKLLEISGVANINLVTPTHYLDKILQALNIYKPKIPIIWNTSGYESPENIKKLKGFVDVFLFDGKYFSKDLAGRYSKATNYFENFLASIIEAKRIVPKNVIIDGVLKKGIIVRHLVLPGCYMDSIEIFKHIKKAVGCDVFVSIMSQYVPMFKAKDYPEINRRLSPLEYKKVTREVIKLGFDKGYIQDFDSQSESYTPDFSDKKFFEI